MYLLRSALGVTGDDGVVVCMLLCWLGYPNRRDRRIPPTCAGVAVFISGLDSTLFHSYNFNFHVNKFLPTSRFLTRLIIYSCSSNLIIKRFQTIKKFRRVSHNLLSLLPNYSPFDFWVWSLCVKSVIGLFQGSSLKYKI